MNNVIFDFHWAYEYLGGKKNELSLNVSSLSAVQEINSIFKICDLESDFIMQTSYYSEVRLLENKNRSKFFANRDKLLELIQSAPCSDEFVTNELNYHSEPTFNLHKHFKEYCKTGKYCLTSLLDERVSSYRKFESKLIAEIAKLQAEIVTLEAELFTFARSVVKEYALPLPRKLASTDLTDDEYVNLARTFMYRELESLDFGEEDQADRDAILDTQNDKLFRARSGKYSRLRKRSSI